MLFSWFFFFKQKTAYEMRISDWSSDVCSSDLPCARRGIGRAVRSGGHERSGGRRRDEDLRDIGAMRDRLRGTYTAPSDPNGILSRTTRVVKQANYIRMLGDMTLSAIPVKIGRVPVRGRGCPSG